MKIHVMSENNIKNLFKTNQINKESNVAIISIKSPPEPFPREGPGIEEYVDKFPKFVLMLQFHDVSTVNERYDEFTTGMANAVNNFIKDVIDDEVPILICQCELGISRSSAIAAAISKWLIGDDSLYFNNYIPNKLVYSRLLNTLMNDK